jgi:serine/threonine protein kinase
VTTEERLDELRLRWQELRQQGQTPSVKELCADCPELAEALQQKLETVDYWETFLGVATKDYELRDASTDRAAQHEVPNPFPGEFRILRRLGEGGFGTLWLAEDLHLGRLVALKTVRLASASELFAPRLLRLREEARLLAAIVTVHGTRVTSV